MFNLKDEGLKENRSLKDTFPTVYSYFKKKWGHLDEEEVFPYVERESMLMNTLIPGISLKKPNFQVLSTSIVLCQTLTYLRQIMSLPRM